MTGVKEVAAVLDCQCHEHIHVGTHVKEEYRDCLSAGPTAWSLLCVADIADNTDSASIATP